MNIHVNVIDASRTDIFYLVSTGRKSVMYSLYLVCEGDPRSYLSQPGHITNLSEDFNTAVEKATDWIQSNADQYAILEDNIVDLVARPQAQNDRAEDLYYLRMKSGKHEGKHILHDLLSVDIKYVLWLLRLAKEKQQRIWADEQHFQLDYRNPENFLSKREQWLFDHSDLIWAEYFKQFPRPVESESNWVGEVGQRIDRELKYKNHTSIDGQYGLSWIILFTDRVGNIFKYFGGTWPKFPKDDDGNDLEWATYRFTIKGHGEFRNVKQTSISRIAVPKTKS